MYKISEHKVNPKVLSVANSCDYKENWGKSFKSPGVQGGGHGEN